MLHFPEVIIDIALFLRHTSLFLKYWGRPLKREKLKGKKAAKSAAEGGNSTSTPNKFLFNLKKKANMQEATGPKKKIPWLLITAIMRQKRKERSEKNVFQKILRPKNCPILSKIPVYLVL